MDSVSSCHYKGLGLVMGNYIASGQVYLRPMVVSKGSDANVFMSMGTNLYDFFFNIIVLEFVSLLFTKVWV